MFQVLTYHLPAMNVLKPFWFNNSGNKVKCVSNVAPVFNDTTLFIPDNHEYLPVNKAVLDAVQTCSV